MTEPVDKELCKAKHGELIRRVEVADKRLNAHSESLADMKEVIMRLTVLQETSAKLQETSLQTMKDQNTAMAAIDKRVLELETQRVTAEEQENKNETFWGTPGGQWIIKGSVVIALIITLAAIGQNVNPEFLASIFGK